MKHQINDVLRQDENNDITYDQMKSITKLDLDGDITDLKGIESAVNLEEIDIDPDWEWGVRYFIKNINLLTQLQHLTTLNFVAVSLTTDDITSSGQMTNLKVLKLARAEVYNSYLTNLTNLTNLESLNLGGNHLTDLRPLSALPCVLTAYAQGIYGPEFNVYGPNIPTKMSFYERDGSEHVVNLTKQTKNGINYAYAKDFLPYWNGKLDGHVRIPCILQKLSGETEREWQPLF